MTKMIFLILTAYFLGSVSFAMILSKLHGVDIRSVGSGNVGATNLSRALGKKWGYICFLLDVLKGLIPTMIATMLIDSQPSITELWLWLAVGCAAIFGHVFPVYLKFKGGKGVATSLGVVLGIFPYYTFAGMIAFLAWIILVLLFKYISLASILAAVVFPVILLTMIKAQNDWQVLQLWPLVVVSWLMPLLVVFRHKNNIKRLLEGTESRVLQNKG